MSFMIRPSVGTFVLVVGCLQAPAPAGVQVATLANPSFDEGTAGALTGWQVQGGEFGSAERVRSPVASGSGALRMTAGSRGSTGQASLMVSQQLDPDRYRGRTVRFGARVRTDGAGVNLVVWTPEGSSNILVDDPAIGTWSERTDTFTIPSDANVISFGIQLFGREGTSVLVDDAFVQLVGEDPDVADWSAEVAIDPTRELARLDPRLFGMHIEWVEDGQGLLDPRTGELRPRVLELLEPLNVPLFRFPGGIHADYYDWRLGVGAERGRSENVFEDEMETHRFGSPEFVELVRRTGAEPLITANFGTGTAAEAAAWARWFRESGRDVHLWEVGNEIYLADPEADAPNGRAIHHPPEAYARRFPDYRRGIRQVFPGALVGIIGHLDTGTFPLAPEGNRNWTEEMLRSLDADADFIAVHNAYAPVIVGRGPDMGDAGRRRAVYRSMYAATEQIRENLDEVAQTVARLSPRNADIPIAITEYGPFFGFSTDGNTQNAFVDHTRTMGSALYVASLLHTFARDPRVTMAAYTNPIHRWFGSLLTDTDEGLVRTPTYHVFRLYRSVLEARVVSATVRSPTFDTETVGIVRARRGVPELDVLATVDEGSSRMGIALVNRNPERALETTVRIEGAAPEAARCSVLSGPSPTALSGPAITRTTRTAARPIEPATVACDAGAEMTVQVPANGVLTLAVTLSPRGRSEP